MLLFYQVWAQKNNFLFGKEICLGFSRFFEKSAFNLFQTWLNLNPNI